jgi:hypothetical protein
MIGRHHRQDFSVNLNRQRQVPRSIRPFPPHPNIITGLIRTVLYPRT